jgi:site-specific DNA-methyltransferase (adenine-specific)
MAAQPFAARLICSNEAEFRYDLIWRKNKPVGFLNAKKQPLRTHEHVLLFYRKPPKYTPQMTTGHRPGNYAKRTKVGTNYAAPPIPTEYGGATERYPTSVIDVPIINNDDPDKSHPTQKPVDLMRWLVRSYSEPGQIILDITAGSGTTGVAAIMERRVPLCIERDPQYAAVAAARMAQAQVQLP